MRESLIKPLVLITALIIIVLVVLAIVFTPRSTSSNITINTTGQPTLGKANARVQIVAFEDLKCPNCRDFNLTILPTIKEKYVDTGVATYTSIILAFIPGSIPAGNAAFCLREQHENYFFAFVEYVFQHQPPEEQDWATIPTLLKFARIAAPKANLQQLSTCIFNSKHTPTLQNNLKLATDVMNGQVETPTIYVNGTKVRPLTLKHLEASIKSAQQ